MPDIGNSLTLPEEGFHIHLFLDTDLLSQEIADVTKRTEKQNATIKRKKAQAQALVIDMEAPL